MNKFRTLTDVYLSGKTYQHEKLENPPYTPLSQMYKQVYTEAESLGGIIDLPAAEFVAKLLVDKHPDKFSKSAKKERVQQKDAIDLDTFTDILLDLPEHHDDLIDIDSIHIVPPETPFHGKIPSRKFPLISFEATIRVKRPKKKIQYPTPDKEWKDEETHEGEIEIDFDTGIIKAGNPDKLPDPVKESMPAIMLDLRVNEQLSGDADEALLLFKRIENADIPTGIDHDAFEQCVSTAKYFTKQVKQKGKMLANFKNQINDVISVAMLLDDAGYTPDKFVYERGKTYDKIRKIATHITSGQADLWNPSDMYIIPKDEHDSIIGLITARLEDTQDSNTQLNALNSMFAPQFEPQDINWETTPLLGISLKQENAQAGKAKTYLQSMARPQDLDINLTDEEISQPAEFYQQRIGQILTSITEYVNQHPSVDFTKDTMPDFSAFNKVSDKEWLQTKYGAFKILEYILSTNDPGFFRNIALASIKVTDKNTSPAFFKVIGNKSGMAKLEGQKFNSVSIANPPVGFGVLLKDVFSVTNQGIYAWVDLIFVGNEVTGKEDRKTLSIQIRPQGGTQLAVDGKYI